MQQNADPGLILQNDLSGGNDHFLLEIGVNDLDIYYDSDGQATAGTPVKIA